MDTSAPPSPSARVADALQAFLRGNLQKADMQCRLALAEWPQHTDAWLLLARIAESVGAQVTARHHLQQARRCAPSAEIHELPGTPEPATPHPPTARHLLIKAWGFGFWSDMDHVHGALLLAELTGRTPIVHWGANSLFRDADTGNAFDSFFEPVSDLTLDDLQSPGLSHFPPKWNAGNLLAPEISKWQGEGSRLTGLYLLHRPEDTVVADFHIKVNDLMPWIPVDHPFHGMDRSQIYRHLNEKYIRLRAHLRLRIESFWQSQMASHHWLAVHVRGTDKVQEIGNLDAINASYESRIDQILAVNPALRIFLMTDSTQVVGQFRRRYGDRILALDCQRGSGQQGVHLEGHPGTEMGEQVVTDAFMASHCDFFLGNGGSNVSIAIRHLKTWAPGTFFLIGDDFLGTLDPSLHQW